ncbi:MAG: type II toxin-antitoxin system VapC family toxin [Dechloromonas sp.]|uniref:Ribonuclease VapC n=1 Tax=Candidatus Dechloromonas phosphorivorans TaxID=2899244 RepID=A0A9D7LUB2_9RHOO|nr:type II toxin-antitoxin system VapC family toxin [Candidatus Dechloromonas phosphorivorans]
MIILDTNVLSALMQQQPDAQVVAWLDEQPAESVWLNSITLFEARCGLALLASGQPRSLLQERFEALLQDDLQNRVLPFDDNAALQAAQLAADRKARGCPVDMRDTFIAGIARARRATLATRNVRHFDDLSVLVVNPWGQK